MLTIVIWSEEMMNYQGFFMLNVHSRFIVIFCLLINFSVHREISAFDKENLGKAAKLLEQKEKNRKLEILLFPSIYTEKKVIDERQYLEKRAGKFLKSYEKKFAQGLQDGISNLLSCASCLVITRGLPNNNGEAVACSLIIGVVGLAFGLTAFKNLIFDCLLTLSSETEEEKNIVLGKMLDEKIAKEKAQIEKNQILLASRANRQMQKSFFEFI